jgi:hypothetical protein
MPLYVMSLHRRRDSRRSALHSDDGRPPPYAHPLGFMSSGSAASPWEPYTPTTAVSAASLTTSASLTLSNHIHIFS